MAAKQQRGRVLTMADPEWKAFRKRLGGPEGCNFREEHGKTVWTCKGNHALASAILATMREVDVDGTLAYCGQLGGYCDCEILFNVGAEDGR